MENVFKENENTILNYYLLSVLQKLENIDNNLLKQNIKTP